MTGRERRRLNKDREMAMILQALHQPLLLDDDNLLLVCGRQKERQLIAEAERVAARGGKHDA